MKELYKKTSTGAIQYWQISVYEDSNHSSAYIIETEYGQVGTGSPQTTFDTIYEGKNIGKANETSVCQQAEAEAQAKWEKQKKKGYVESIGDAKADVVDEIIEGGIVPMLAFTFEKQGHKIKYPCYVQPKLDGIRCIAVVEGGKCTLWSRTRKRINSCPHIIAEIEKFFKDDIILDGELYNDDFNDNFEHIVHLVRQDEPDAQCTDVEYHIYDTVNKDPFKLRTSALENMLENSLPNYIKLVLTETVDFEDRVPDFFLAYKEMGYEGAMLRNSNGLYANKRSADLIKVKEMQDEEFKVVDIEEGRGKLAGHVGAFVCLTSDGKEFKAKMSGATEKLRDYFKDESLWKNKLLTVQFQDYTSYGIPRFPVGLRFRDDL
jgi:DNA ligase-1